ncbi:MAG: hypothetical protein L0387_13315 [Acidobacteria bacterium]|nr:hypothetical protein [Acidobacteriota bacterium]MCI0719865.1 hypothetical protein [Acidobacteriota bacterium]
MKDNRWQLVVYLCTFAMLSGTAAPNDIPKNRRFRMVRPYSGVEVIVVGVSKLQQPDETKVLADKQGIYLNTNQEFIYIPRGTDFQSEDFVGPSDVTGRSLETSMTLYADTPRLPVTGGTRSLEADGQNLTVTIIDRGDYSSLAIALDRRFNRPPRWIPSAWGGPTNPGGYQGYETEHPFCGRTLDAVLSALTGDSGKYRPDYYVVMYEGLAGVVVPLKFQPVSKGRRLQHRHLEDISAVMFGVSPQQSSRGDRSEEIDARVGPLGLSVVTTRELACTSQFRSMEGGRNETMYITLDTPQKLPVRSGLHTLAADGQDVSVGVWHQQGLSRLLIQLPRTYQRTPHWWPKSWGGGLNPGNYPGAPTERPFCERTVQAVLQRLVTGDAGAYKPSWYTVSYASSLTLRQVNPWVDISFQGDVTCTFVVPSRSRTAAIRREVR